MRVHENERWMLTSRGRVLRSCRLQLGSFAFGGGNGAKACTSYLSLPQPHKELMPGLTACRFRLKPRTPEGLIGEGLNQRIRSAQKTEPEKAQVYLASSPSHGRLFPTRLVTSSKRHSNVLDKRHEYSYMGMIILSLLRRGPAATGSGHCIARQWQKRSGLKLKGLSSRSIHQAHHDTQLRNIRNIGIIAHVDAVSQVLMVCI